MFRLISAYFHLLPIYHVYLFSISAKNQAKVAGKLQARIPRSTMKESLAFEPKQSEVAIYQIKIY